MEETHTNGEAKPVAAENGAGMEEKPKATVSRIEEPQTLEELVRQEIEASRVSVQRLCTWGVLAAVCLMSYLAWLYQSVQDNFFNPESVAAFVSGTIDEQLPSILGRTERDAISSAPQQVDAMSHRLQAAIPQVRQVAERQIEEIYLQMPLLRESLNGALRAYLGEHHKELKDFADAHDDREFVGYFTSHVLAELRKELRVQLGSSQELSLKKVQEQSLGQLVLLNERLKSLAETSPYYMSRRDIVARRLVAVFASLLHESAAEVKAGAPLE